MIFFYSKQLLNSAHCYTIPKYKTKNKFSHRLDFHQTIVIVANEQQKIKGRQLSYADQFIQKRLSSSPKYCNNWKTVLQYISIVFLKSYFSNQLVMSLSLSLFLFRFYLFYLFKLLTYIVLNFLTYLMELLFKYGFISFFCWLVNVKNVAKTLSLRQHHNL